MTAYVIADVEWRDEVQHAKESEDFVQILENSAVGSSCLLRIQRWSRDE